MSRDYLLERRRESRLSRFGMALGLFVSFILFTVLFSFSFVKYEPILEKARVKRVLVARPYKPRALKTKKAEGGAKPKPQSNRPKPKAQPNRRPPKPNKAPVKPLKKPPSAKNRKFKPKPTNKTIDPWRAPDKPTEENAPEADAEDLNAMLADLESRNAELEELDEALGAGVEEGDGLEGLGEGLGTGVGDGEGGYLDSRININVVSYPKTSIEDIYPEIEYPDLRFKRDQLQAGICRVYYRVWTDNMGRIVKDELKTPSTEEELKKYSVFVDAVKSSIEYWVFDKVKAEVHIDVLFEIE